MKIVYKTSSNFVDSDFPLIKQLQLMGHEVFTFIDLPCYGLRSTLVDIKKQKSETGIIKATEYDEFKIFESYFDTSNLYVVNRVEQSLTKWSNIKVNHQLCKRMGCINPEVVVTPCIPDVNDWEILLRFKSKIVLTVHDPFPHTGENSGRKKFARTLAMNICKKFVLLNKTQYYDFINYWHLPAECVLVNKMGVFDYMHIYLQKEIPKRIGIPRILFYGRISPYKGIEYLLEAMKIVHERVPDATLIIAGGGKMYFDITPYMNLPYVEIRNHYIGMEELAGQLQICSLVVCPYTDATQSGVVLTSFAMGKPVIATNVGAMGEYIEDGITGILVPPRDSKALADAICETLVNPKKLDMMTNAVKGRNESDTDGWKNIVERYMVFYKK